MLYQKGAAETRIIATPYINHHVVVFLGELRDLNQQCFIVKFDGSETQFAQFFFANLGVEHASTLLVAVGEQHVPAAAKKGNGEVPRDGALSYSTFGIAGDDDGHVVIFRYLIECD